MRWYFTKFFISVGTGLILISLPSYNFNIIDELLAQVLFGGGAVLISIGLLIHWLGSHRKGPPDGT